VVTPAVSFTRPQLTYENLHPIDEYLFDRRSPFAGHSFECDYLLRLSKQEGVRVDTCQRFHIDPHMNRINNPVIITSGGAIKLGHP
jgi:hypothetical protein